MPQQKPGLYFRLLCSLLAVAAVFFHALETRASKSQVKPTLTATEEDNGRQIVIERNMPFILKLRGNETTGYAWRITRQNKGRLRLLSNDYVVDSQKRSGAGGVRILTFKPLASGKTTLECKLYRPWIGVDSQDPDSRVFRLQIIIR